MDKLEQYLDQVCRGIAGPRSLRQHIRQELREHLLDAAADHQSAGMSNDQALAKAIEDFGAPGDVRSELEATHGHRLMAVVIDKAMQWKENTMKGRWFWMSWAHVALAMVVVIEALFISSSMVFVVPKIRQYAQEGLLSVQGPIWGIFMWLIAAYANWLWMVIPLLIVWVLFEWRARGDNKPFIRLAGMGTVALALAIADFLLAASMVLPLAINMSFVANRQPEPVVHQALGDIETSLSAAEQGLAKNDWDVTSGSVIQAEMSAEKLARMGAAVPAIMAESDPSAAKATQSAIDSGCQTLRDAREAALAKDPARLEAALRRFRQSWPRVSPATRPD
jgi:hypothetical protein